MGYSINRFNFPGGEVHVRLVGHKIPGKDVFFLRNSDDIMAMLLAVDAARRVNVPFKSVCIPYIPYARQDRVTENGEPLSIVVMARLINMCGFSSVVALDPHSDVTPALIDNLKVMDIDSHILNLAGIVNAQAIVSPDAGARKKTERIHKFISYDIPGMELVYCGKKRDTHTGKLTGFTVEADRVPENVLIVDDICDGGGTFIGLAKELREKGAKRVSLFVSHGIFSKGVNALFDGGIDDVLTTDSYCQLQCSDDGRFYVLELFK